MALNYLRSILLKQYLNVLSKVSSARIASPYLQFSTNSHSKDEVNSSKVKTGILMMNMGGPSSLNEVNDFLTRLFTDKDIIPLPMQNTLGRWIAQRRTPKIMEKYKEIGGGSPILKWTNIQGKLMTELLDKINPDTAPHKHYVGFRYAKPLMEDTLDEMERDGVERAVAFSQYPQYSCSTSGSSFNAFYRYFQRKKTKMKWSFIDRWPTHPNLIECLTDLIQKEIDAIPSQDRDNLVILFSAHALPMKAVEIGDPYVAEVAGTVLGVMQRLNLKYAYRLVWQSKVGPTRWLSPQTDDAIRGFVFRRWTSFVVVPISFVNEHIETLHELDIEYADLAHKLGVKHFRRVPTPNDHPVFIECLADVVKSHLNSEDICSPHLLIKCPFCLKQQCETTKKWLVGVKKSEGKIL